MTTFRDYMERGGFGELVAAASELLYNRLANPARLLDALKDAEEAARLYAEEQRTQLENVPNGRAGDLPDG